MLDQYKDQGYEKLPSFFTETQMRSLEYSITWLYHTQCQKIGEYRKVPLNFKSIVNSLEETDKSALYEAFRMLPQSPMVRNLFGHEFLTKLGQYTNAAHDAILMDGPSLFINVPKSNRIKAKWHTEALYYPKRRNFVNIWMPIFTDRTAANGAMVILPQSHKQSWDASMFAEYSGYDKASEGKRDHLRQYEIPEYFLKDYTKHTCESVRGDIYVFNRNLVHTSADNTTNDPSFALVVRLFDVTNDITLSADLCVTPYSGNDVGRSNLVVKP